MKIELLKYKGKGSTYPFTNFYTGFLNRSWMSYDDNSENGETVYDIDGHLVQVDTLCRLIAIEKDFELYENDIYAIGEPHPRVLQNYDSCCFRYDNLGQLTILLFLNNTLVLMSYDADIIRYSIQILLFKAEHRKFIRNFYEDKNKELKDDVLQD